MKNTKLNQGLEPENIQDQPSKSKRKILASIGVLGASALSHHWAKPVVNSVILPAHAQMTEMPGGGDDMMETPMPSTEPPPKGKMIKIVDGQAGNTVGDATGGEAGKLEYHISLSQEPLRTVTVTVTVAPSASGDVTGGTGENNAGVFMFTRANYKTEQTATVTAPDGSDASSEEIKGTVNFVATGSEDYADVTASREFTIVNDDPAAPTGVMVKATQTNSGGAGNGAVMVDWTAPKTSADILYYLVHQGSSAISSTPDADDSDENVDAGATSALITGLGEGTYHFAVTAVYGPRGTAANFQTGAPDPASPIVIS